MNALSHLKLYESQKALLQLQETFALVEVQKITEQADKIIFTLQNVSDIYAVEERTEQILIFQRRDNTDSLRWKAGKVFEIELSQSIALTVAKYSLHYAPLQLTLYFEEKRLSLFQNGLIQMQEKVLEMQKYIACEAIFKYVDLLLHIAIMDIQYQQNTTQECLIIEVEIVEEVYAELAEKSEKLVFREGYEADFPKKNFTIGYPNVADILFLPNYWQFPYLNITLNFDAKVLHKFRKRKTDWMEEMY